MIYAFSYHAKAKNGSLLNGITFAESEEEAYLRIKNKLNLIPIDIQVDPMATLNNWIGSDFNQKELSKLYKTISKRLKNGRPIVDALEQAQEFITDKKLKFAVGTMLAMILDGYPEHQAMEEAGFSKRDFAAIAAGSTGGKQPDIFYSLSEDYDRNIQLASDIKKSVMPLYTMLVLMYAAFYLLITVSAPKMKKFIDEVSKMTKKAQDPIIQAYYDFTEFFNNNIEISTIVYLLVPAGFIIIVRSSIFKAILNSIQLVKKLNEKKEMASLWNSFGLLYDASVNVEQICDMLMDGAKDNNIKNMFLNMRNSIRRGSTVEVAVKESGFPDYIVRGVSFAALSNLGEGLRDFSKELIEDVEMLSAQLKQLVQMFSLIFSALFVMTFFFVSYYPVLSGTLKNL